MFLIGDAAYLSATIPKGMRRFHFGCICEAWLTSPVCLAAITLIGPTISVVLITRPTTRLHGGDSETEAPA